MSTPLDQYDLPAIETITDPEVPLDKSETIASLQHELESQRVPSRDVVTPANAELFPEEYELETDTGLVKTTTVASVKGGNHGLTKEKLEKAVERNRKELEKGDGWWDKLKKHLSFHRHKKE